MPTDVVIASRSHGLFEWSSNENAEAILLSEAPGLAALALSASGNTIYGVGGLADGWLRAWHVTASRRTLVAHTPTQGCVPCHVCVDSSSGLMIANHSSGTIVRFCLDDAGVPAGAPRVVRDGHSEGSLPHQVLKTRDGTAIVDLGTDEILVSAGSPPHEWTTIVALPAGTGPRHAVLSAGQVVAATAERAGGVSLRTAEGWITISSTRINSQPVSRGTRNAPGDLLLRGDYLYVANRGYDTIGIIDRRTAQLVDEVSVGGQWPQHLLALDDRLLVACEDSNELRSLAWMPHGRLAPSRHEAACPQPAWLLALPESS